MSAIDNLLAAVGGIGNAAGVQGSGPGGLNALQRASLPSAQSEAYGIQSALSTLAQDPNFQQMQPADKMSALTHITGDPALAQKALASLSAPSIDLSNPRQAIQTGVQTGNIAPQEGVQDLMNPVMGMGALAQLNQGGAQPAAPAGTPVAAATPSATPQAAPPAKTGVDYNYLNQAKQISPVAGLMAENMIAGVFNPESGKGENDPVYNMALQIARRADPTFNPQALIGRPQMVKNSTSGDMYKLETSLNTGMSHLYDLHAMAPLTRNSPGSSPLVNAVGRYENEALGGEPYADSSRYAATLNTAAPEIAKYLGGGAATDTGTAEARGNFSENQPPDVIQKNAADLGAKMMAKGGSLQNEYNAAMGAAGTHKVVQPMTEALYADMQGKPLMPEQQQLVNAHRAESNLPPKTWGKPAAAPQNRPAPDAAAIAEARKRGFK